MPHEYMFVMMSMSLASLTSDLMRICMPSPSHWREYSMSRIEGTSGSNTESDLNMSQNVVMRCWPSTMRGHSSLWSSATANMMVPMK